MTKIINFFAGPGAGKSTLAAGLFYELKMLGCNAELAPEYAKDLTWERRHDTLKVQPYIFGKQYNRIARLIGKVDVIVTDCPLILCIMYSGKNFPPSFSQSILDLFNQFENVNYFVNRKKDYNPAGRNQTEEEAKAIDQELANLLNDNKVPYKIVNGTPGGLRTISTEVLSILGIE